MSWFKDFKNRVQFINSWLTKGPPPCYWMSAFYFPQGFMTSVLQKHARLSTSKGQPIAIDQLLVHTEVIDAKVEEVKAPETGVYIVGLHLQGASWDRKTGKLTDERPGQLFEEMPPIWLKPSTDAVPKSGVYECPVYKTSDRAGELLSTGHSTNFVMDLRTFLFLCVLRPCYSKH